MKKDVQACLKNKKPIDEFTRKVIQLILKIPRGKVVTYGQLAELAGKPNRSRQVGFILRTVCNPERVPWQRVIGSSGRISFPRRNKNYKLQRKRLESEGVVFSGERVDLERYRWRRRPKNSPRMFSW